MWLTYQRPHPHKENWLPLRSHQLLMALEPELGLGAYLQLPHWGFVWLELGLACLSQPLWIHVCDRSVVFRELFHCSCLPPRTLGTFLPSLLRGPLSLRGGCNTGLPCRAEYPIPRSVWLCVGQLWVLKVLFFVGFDFAHGSFVFSPETRETEKR